MKAKLFTIKKHREKANEVTNDNTQKLEASLRRLKIIRELQDNFWEVNLSNNTIQLSKHDSTFQFHEDDQLEDLFKWSESIHSADRSNFLNTIKDPKLTKNDKLTLTIRLSTSPNVYKWIMLRGIVSEVDSSNSPSIITGIFSDISDIKKAELDINKSNLRLKTTIARLNNGVLLEDENRKIIITNQKFCDIFHIPVQPELLTGSDCSQSAEQVKHLFTQPEQFAKRIEELLFNKEPVVAEVLEMVDGRILERDFLPVILDNEYIGHLWNYRDITNSELSRKILSANEEKYRSIIDNMKLGLLEVDNEERILNANQCFCDITGYSLDELKGSVASGYLLKEKNIDVMREVNEARKHGISNMYEIQIKDKAGKIKWLLISGAPLYNPEGHQTGSIGIHLDISAQKKLESELREAKLMAEESVKAKEIFLANMSHEIRTPMNAILGMSNLLKKTSLNQEQKNYLKAISTSGENLLVIINDILDLSKIESGKLKTEAVNFNLRESLEQLEKMFMYKAQEKGLLYHICYSLDMPENLIGDPYRINQILINLVGNAIKFTDKGKVTVSVTFYKNNADQYDVKFKVSDTGIGMDDEYKKRLFENFSQEDPGITRKYGGTGLGLAISRRLTELMNGSLEIESTKGEGTSISFTIPLRVGTKKAPETIELQTNEAKKPLAGLKVLLVEDNEFNRLLATTILSNHGASVTEASHGLEATKKAQNDYYDVILMDIQMPVMNGYDASIYIRQNINQKIPIIAQTANAVKGEDKKCLKAGMNDYISKPFEEQKLINKILKVINRSKKMNKVNAYTKIDKEETPYDITILEEMAQGDRAFISKMLQTVVDTVPAEIAKLESAYENKDLKTVKSVAHKIKPSLLNLKITAGSTIREIEIWEDNQDWELLGEKIQSSKITLEAVINRIKEDHLK
ncbi:hybrid sensor histidine kinase/response regulator [Fulvivirga sediminis]|uniref:histidine kinase n=1 Tax=Fulvivirga sediminis TaxID=2803949 RepID=A0A937F812_9BACT|nr:ATP-binding protein [Fulvivirga sediminis]MBL3656791.1 response regulator [Fulvivirga sediminis]